MAWQTTTDSPRTSACVSLCKLFQAMEVFVVPALSLLVAMFSARLLYFGGVTALASKVMMSPWQAQFLVGKHGVLARCF